MDRVSARSQRATPTVRRWTELSAALLRRTYPIPIETAPDALGQPRALHPPPHSSAGIAARPASVTFARRV